MARRAVARSKRGVNSPTNRFTISEPHDQHIGEFYVAQKRHMTNFEAPKL